MKGTVYVTCPTTHQPVNLRIEMTPEAFETWEFRGEGTPCPHCGQTHQFTKAEARLEPSPGGGGDDR